MTATQKEWLSFLGWFLFFIAMTILAGLLISRSAKAGGPIQMVIFNPPVGGQSACVITSFQYLNGVLRLGTGPCISDRVFVNGFENG